MQRALAHIFVYYYYYKQGLGAEKDSTSERKTCKCIVLEKDMSWFDLKESRQGFCRREGKVVPCRGAEDRKGVGISSGKSIMRNPETETESMRRRAESTGGSVNLNTVTEIRRSSGRDTFIAKSTVFPLHIILCGIGSLQVDK